MTAVFFPFGSGGPVPLSVSALTPCSTFVFLPSVCLFVLYSEAGFDSPAKLASRPRMRVLPHFGGTSYFPFMLPLGSMDIALRPLCRLKHKKLT